VQIKIEVETSRDTFENAGTGSDFGNESSTGNTIVNRRYIEVKDDTLTPERMQEYVMGMLIKVDSHLKGIVCKD
jgi:hypothetical protein